MKKMPGAPEDAEGSTARPPLAIRLPGFILDETVGLGDVIKRVTYAAGIKPCAGCSHRAAALNEWIVFARRR